jgi:hypothetical protein
VLAYNLTIFAIVAVCLAVIRIWPMPSCLQSQLCVIAQELNE